MIGTTKIQFIILYLISFFALLTVSAVIYLQYHQISITAKSLILYTNYQSPETITNWIVDTNTGEKWEVGKGLATGGWSPSGKYIFYYTLLPSPTEIWISDAKGGNLHQVFDSKKYPELKITSFNWLSDEIILVNVVNIVENYGYVYQININAPSFEIIGKGNFLNIAQGKNYWFHYIEQYYLMNLTGDMAPIKIDRIADLYTFSLDSNQWAYFCNRKEDSSSLCLADINMRGVTNENIIADVETPVVTLDIWWSQNGKYIGIQTYNRTTNETRFRAINISDGKTIYDWKFPTTTTRNFWSPHNDKVIDFNGLMLT